jgi:hypothetical protein
MSRTTPRPSATTATCSCPTTEAATTRTINQEATGGPVARREGDRYANDEKIDVADGSAGHGARARDGGLWQR